MHKIIPPLLGQKDGSLKESAHINPFVDLLKVYQGFSLPLELKKRSTFLVAHDHKRGVYGGVVIYPEKVTSFLSLDPDESHEEGLQKIFGAFHRRKEFYWRARICLSLDVSESSPFIETIILCQTFYRRVYEALVAFGVQKNIDLLPLTLRKADARLNHSLKIMTYESWPFLMEVKLGESFDHRSSLSSQELFHGLLSLHRNSCPHRKRRGFSVELPRSSRFSSQAYSPQEGDSL